MTARSNGSSTRVGRAHTRPLERESHPRHRGAWGFTLVEVLVSLVILALLTLLAVPAFFSIDARRKLEGTGEQASVLLRKARYDAIRDGQARCVAFDPAEQALFIDRDGDFALGTAEGRGGVVRLPRGVEAGGPGDDAAEIDGFTDLGGPLRVAVFEPTGSLRSDGGAFRLHDVHDNYLEVRVTDPATAAVVLRKWDDGAWWVQGEGGRTWEWSR